MIRIEDVIDKVSINRPNADVDLIRRAYLFSALHHRGQTRASGEPYLVHPIEVAEILADMTMVAEGVKSSPSVLDLARRYGVDMPITEQVVAVCNQGRPAREALAALMQRSNKSEH
mgnify:CR=1 FL=1